MTPATRRRFRAAVLALPTSEREHHLAALAALLHLLEHCAVRCEPRGFVARHRAYRLSALRWAAELLERTWIECTVPNCRQQDRVSLLSARVPLAESGR